MSDKDHIEIDEATGQSTTGHEWDGIKELDTPLPRWWLHIFYATIAIAAVYWVMMPAWPGLPGMPAGADHTTGVLGHSDRALVVADVDALKASRQASFAQLQAASFAEIEADPQKLAFANAAGEAVFGDNCRTCHGAGGQGQIGYPNLVDNDWIWGGTLEDIIHTLNVGIRSDHPDTLFSDMPAYGEILTAAQIDDVTEYVLAFSSSQTGETIDTAAAARGAATYQAQCVTCHGPSGAGDRTQGAPALNDDIWLYGGGRDQVREQIVLGRGGVMPAWSGRLDENTIRAVAIYVYALGGGEASAPAAPTAPDGPTTPPTTPLR